MMDVAESGRETEAFHVLVVDDDPGMREMLLRVLGSRHWQAEGAEDGLRALARLQHAPFDVVVTDVQMPSLDGLALLREVRRMGCGIQVVVHSGDLDPTTTNQLRRAGAFRVLRKGDPLDLLIQSVEEAGRVAKSPPSRCA